MWCHLVTFLDWTPTIDRCMVHEDQRTSINETHVLKDTGLCLRI